MFKDDKADIIIFGHSHQPIIKTINKTLMLNPGSPISKRRERWFSVIILELEKDYINANLKFFSKI
jgi:putative phosphoesterase